MQINSRKLLFTGYFALNEPGHSCLVYVFGLPQGPGEHGRQHHPALLQRGHLHPGYRELSGLLACHSVRDLTAATATALDSSVIILSDSGDHRWVTL